MGVLSVFTPATREWFERTFDGPTPAQERGWPAIASGEHTLIQAPTGSGKTLAAFLYGIDRLTAEPGEGLRLLYVSPLKALNYDIERNLRGPLAGLRSELRVSVRTGDTPQKERAAMLREHPDILITTPESLYLMLTSRAREMLRERRDPDPRRGARRGGHEAGRAPGALRRAARPRDHVQGQPRPSRGSACRPRSGRWRRSGASSRAGRPIELVDAGRAKELDLEVVVPLEDMREPGESEELDLAVDLPGDLKLVEEHRSTIVFVNNRRLAERLALRLNELANEGVEDDAKRRRSRAPTTARWPASSGSRSRSC